MILAFAGSSPAAPATPSEVSVFQQEIMLLSGNANRKLSEEISQYLEIPLMDSLVSQFSDGETRVELFQNIRGKNVFILQSLSNPINHSIMELLVMVDACKRASASKIIVVLPYFAYARQERKSASRTPISAKLLADLLEASGANRVLTLELHTSAIQGFFNIPVDHLYSKPIFYDYFKDHDPSTLAVVSPDSGGAERTRALAKKFGSSMAIIDKRRDRPNECAAMKVLGDVSGKHCLILDDIVDTAGSLTKAAGALMDSGAKSVSAAITHPVLSGKAIENIKESCLKELLVTNSIALSEEALSCKKIKQLSIGRLMGEAIKRVYLSDSISHLFV